MANDFLDRLDPDESSFTQDVPDHSEFMARTLQSRSNGELVAVPITLDDLIFLLGGE
jgi:hypothetical protein